MPVEVQATASTLLSKGQHRVVFRNPRGNKWRYAFFYSSALSRLRAEKSSDGSTWTVAGDISFDDPECMDLKIVEDAGNSRLNIHMVWHNGTATRYVRIVINDTATDIGVSPVRDIDASINDIMSEPHCIAIAHTDNDRLVVAFTEDFNTMGKDYRRTKLIGSDNDGNNPTWSGETTLDDPSPDGNNDLKGEVWFGLENFSSSYPNRVLICGRYPNGLTVTAHTARSAVPDWNGTAFSSTAQGTVSANSSGAGDWISLLVDDGDMAHVIYWNSTVQFNHRKAATAGDDNWATPVIVKAADVDAATLTLDTGPATDELYCFYHDSADTQDFHYKKTPVDTISWGSEQTVTFASDLIALTSWSRDVEGGLHIGLEDADTDVWYHEVDVSGAPSAGQPVMKRMQGVPTMPGSRDRIGGWN